MEKWVLPKTADIGGVVYQIHSDYRDILEIIDVLNNEEEDGETRMVIALALFYERFDDMPRPDYPEALRYLFDFIACGTETGGGTGSKLMDWDQDYPIISAEINRVAGYEIRQAAYLHWFTFLGYFNCIGEGQLSTIVSIRDKKRRGKKLEKWEQEYYKEHKAQIDLRKRYTKEEQEEMERLNALLGG